MSALPHVPIWSCCVICRDIDTHTHRVGRTGRAGVKGTAHTLVTTVDKEFAGHIVRWDVRPWKKCASSNQTDQAARVAIVVPVQPHFRTGIWLYWRGPPPVQSDQLFSFGAESSSTTPLTLSKYKLLLYGTFKVHSNSGLKTRWMEGTGRYRTYPVN